MIQKIIQFVITYLTIRQIFTETTDETTRDETTARGRRDGDIYGDSSIDPESPTDTRKPTRDKT